MFSNYEPFSICFNMLKIRYKEYNESLIEKHFFNPYDKVNIFINLEGALKNLTMVQDLEQKIVMYNEFDEIIISNILNLAAHYKRFFETAGFDVQMFLYNTDFSSKMFPQYRYNEDFRSYYLVKYNNNPRFVLLTSHLKGKILPDVATLCEFIPGLYYISSLNIEGSLVPYIIAQVDPSRKNLILGGDVYDTQYSFIDNFVNYYINKNYSSNYIYSEPVNYLRALLKTQETDKISKVFYHYNIYTSLLSVLGNRSRSIDGVQNIGPKKLQKYLEIGLEQNIIHEETSSPELLGDIFHDIQKKEDFINSFYCTSILQMYMELTTAQKKTILNQIVDRIDLNALALLNRTRFYNHPLFMEGLVGQTM